LADQLNNLSTYIFRQGLPQTMRLLDGSAVGSGLGLGHQRSGFDLRYPLTASLRSECQIQSSTST
jgi:hypothetical protein